MTHPVIRDISYKEAGIYSFITGCVGYILTRRVIPIDPAVGFFAPASTLFLLTAALKAKSVGKKAISILAIPFVPSLIGKAIGLRISLPANLATISLSFGSIFLIGLYLKAQGMLQELNQE